MIRRLVEPLLHPQGLLILASNALPLLGVFMMGWDAATIVVLYWMETAIIGFWTIVRVIAAPGPLIAAMPDPKPAALNGIGLGLFVLVHAGIFMAVHMLFVATLMPGEWRNHLGSPASFLFGFVIPSGIWLPLAGLFLVRGLITASEMRSGHSPGPVLVGFYARILVMQFVILLGGIASALIGSQVMLVLLIVIKTAADLYFGEIAEAARREFDRARESQKM